MRWKIPRLGMHSALSQATSGHRPRLRSRWQREGAPTRYARNENFGRSQKTVNRVARLSMDQRLAIKREEPPLLPMTRIILLFPQKGSFPLRNESSLLSPGKLTRTNSPFRGISEEENKLGSGEHHLYSVRHERMEDVHGRALHSCLGITGTWRHLAKRGCGR